MSSYDDLNYYEPTPAYQDIWPLIISVIKHIILRILYFIYFTTMLLLKSPRLVAALIEDTVRLLIYFWKNWKQLLKLFFLYFFTAPFAFIRFFLFTIIPFFVKYCSLPLYLFLSFFFKLFFFFFFFSLPAIYIFWHYYFIGFFSIALFNAAFFYKASYIFFFKFLVFSHFFFILYSYYLEYNFFVALFNCFYFYYSFFYFFIYLFIFKIRTWINYHLSETEQDLSFAYIVFAVLSTVPFILFTNYWYIWVIFWLYYIGHTYYINEPDESDYPWAVLNSFLWCILWYFAVYNEFYIKIFKVMCDFTDLFFTYWTCNGFFQYLRARYFMLRYDPGDPEEDEELFEEEWTIIQEGLFWDQVVIEYCTDRLAEGEIPMDDVLDEALDLEKILSDPIFVGMLDESLDYKAVYAKYNPESGEIEIDEKAIPQEINLPKS